MKSFTGLLRAFGQAVSGRSTAVDFPNVRKIGLGIVHPMFELAQGSVVIVQTGLSAAPCDVGM